jgi:hypothetical protein
LKLQKPRKEINALYAGGPLMNSWRTKIMTMHVAPRVGRSNENIAENAIVISCAICAIVGL